MIYKPHNYQKYAIEFIKEHPVAAILLDMGMVLCQEKVQVKNDFFPFCKSH